MLRSRTDVPVVDRTNYGALIPVYDVLRSTSFHGLTNNLAVRACTLIDDIVEEPSFALDTWTDKHK